MMVYPVQELSTAVISQWRKEAMRDALNTLKKNSIKGDRTAKEKLIQKVEISL